MPPFTVASLADDEDFATRDSPDPGHESRAGGFVVVHVPGSQRRELQKWGARVEKTADALPHREFSLFAVPLKVPFPSTGPGAGELFPQLDDQVLHSTRVAAELRIPGINLRFEDIHKLQAIIGAFLGRSR